METKQEKIDLDRLNELLSKLNEVDQVNSNDYIQKSEYVKGNKFDKEVIELYSMPELPENESIFAITGYREISRIKSIKDAIDKYSKEETIEYIDTTVQYIKMLEEDDYFKTRYLTELSKILYNKIGINKPKNIDDKVSKQYYTLYRFTIKEAIELADLGMLYGIAGDCYELTKDFDFSMETYQKAIDWCMQIENTSRLHLLGQNMVMCDNDYFKEYGQKLQKIAKQMSDAKKLEVK